MSDRDNKWQNGNKVRLQLIRHIQQIQLLLEPFGRFLQWFQRLQVDKETTLGPTYNEHLAIRSIFLCIDSYVKKFAYNEH